MTALVVAILGTGCAGPTAARATAPASVSAPSAPTPAATAAADPTLPPEAKHEAGAVTVIASWIPESASMRVAMDTHSVDLDGFDLNALARLRLDGGPWSAPTAWDAPRGGHHRSGTLTFGSLDPAAIQSARLVELEIRDVGASHLLRWER